MPVAKTPSTTLSAANERTMERPKERWHSIIAPMAIVRTTNDARTGMGAIFGSSHVSNFIIKFIMLDVLHQLFSLIIAQIGENAVASVYVRRNIGSKFLLPTVIGRWGHESPADLAAVPAATGIPTRDESKLPSFLL